MEHQRFSWNYQQPGSVYYPKQIRDLVRRACKKDQRSISDFIRAATEEYLEKHYNDIWYDYYYTEGEGSI